MRAILVPHKTEQQKVNLWIGVTESASPPIDFSISITPGGKEIKLPNENWRSVTADGALKPALRHVFIQTVSISNLLPDTTYEVTTSKGAKAQFSTLPASLPQEGGRPFTVLLSSCFYHGNDQEGRLGRTVRLLPEDFKPNVKILCGDQVYLDLPALEEFPDDEAWLAENFLRKYLQTWEQKEGYQVLLENSGSYFTADDHEFWNNYPNWASLINNTWNEKGRERWKKVALALYKDFQSDDASEAGHPSRFSVDKLSFFIADTRVFRKEGDESFMNQADFTQLQQWIQNLEGPGVLVVGQPIFNKPAGWFSGRLEDRALSNYKNQYPDLVRALFKSQHSILILTGDVHYGRVASCELRSSPQPIELIEIIASPSSLVSPITTGKPEDAPPLFPPESINGVVQSVTRTHYKTPTRSIMLSQKEVSEDHFATLHFTNRAGRIRVQVRYWFPKNSDSGTIKSDVLEPVDLL
jgi:hypothetical protein